MTAGLFETKHLQDNLKQRSARGGVATLCAQLVKLSVNLAGIAALSRLLSPDDFGVVAMVTSVTGAMVLLKDMGLSGATIQRETITQAQVNTLFWVNTAVSATASILLAIASPLFVWLYGRPSLVPIVIVSASGFLISGLSVQHQALLSRQMQFFRLALVDVLSIVMGTGLGIAMAWAGYGVWSLVFMQLAIAAISSAGLWMASRWVPGRPHLERSAFSMLFFGAQLTGVNLLNYTSRNADNILIGKFWGALPLGIYYRAYQLLLLPLSQISGPISAVAIPALSRLTDTPERYRRAYLQIIHKVLLIATPGMAFLLAASDLLVHVALGPQWQAAVPIFMWLSIVGFTQPLSNSAGWLFTTQARTGDFLRQASIDCTLSLAAIIGGLPWGAIGVASSYAITGLLFRAPILFWLVGRKGPVHTLDFYRSFLSVFPMAAGVGLTTWLVKGHLVFLPPVAQLIVLTIPAGIVGLGLTLATESGRSLAREIVGFIRKRTSKA